MPYKGQPSPDGRHTWSGAGWVPAGEYGAQVFGPALVKRYGMPAPGVASTGRYFPPVYTGPAPQPRRAPQPHVVTTEAEAMVRRPPAVGQNRAGWLDWWGLRALASLPPGPNAIWNGQGWDAPGQASRARVRGRAGVRVEIPEAAYSLLKAHPLPAAQARLFLQLVAAGVAIADAWMMAQGKPF